MVKALLQVVDKFDFQEMMEGPDHVSEYFRVTVGSEQLNGMDYWRLNEAGLIQEMTEQAGCITLSVTRFSRAALINLTSQQVIDSPEDADIAKISKTKQKPPP